jgi:hypothetical protein
LQNAGLECEVFCLALGRGDIAAAVSLPGPGKSIIIPGISAITMAAMSL